MALTELLKLTMNATRYHPAPVVGSDWNDKFDLYVPRV